LGGELGGSKRKPLIVSVAQRALCRVDLDCDLGSRRLDCIERLDCSTTPLLFECPLFWQQESEVKRPDLYLQIPRIVRRSHSKPEAISLEEGPEQTKLMMSELERVRPVVALQHLSRDIITQAFYIQAGRNRILNPLVRVLAARFSGKIDKAVG